MKFIAFNQGLGDCINYASLVVQFAKKGPVAIACKKVTGQRYEENVRSFFKGYDVKVIPCEGPDQVRELIKQFPDRLCLEEYHETIPYVLERHLDHIKEGYEFAGLNFEDREKYCPIRDQAKKITQIDPGLLSHWKTAFIPEGGSEKQFSIDRKFVNPELSVYVPPQDALLLQYAYMIKVAKEIHVHDTSWPWLIDKLPTTGKLFFHRYARTFEGRPLPHVYRVLKPWQMIFENKPEQPPIMQKGKPIN